MEAGVKIFHKPQSWLIPVELAFHTERGKEKERWRKRLVSGSFRGC